jgi:hypothetical protein
MTSMNNRRINVGNTTLAILSGTEDLSLWSEEELIRGQRRGRNGKWTGRKPLVVPKAIHDELVKRKLTKAYDLLNESIYDAVAVLVDIAQDKDADPAVRLKAAGEILNRTMGKAPERVQIQGDAKWQIAITQGVVSIPEMREGEAPRVW